MLLRFFAALAVAALAVGTAQPAFANANAPTKPAGAPIVTDVSIVAATVVSGVATDDERVATYVTQLLTPAGWVDAASNNITTTYLRTLVPDTTYTVATVAVDPGGARSPRSEPTTFTTRALAPAPGCVAQLVSFGFGYVLYVTVENMTYTTVPAWTVGFALPADHSIGSVFGGTLTRAGGTGTLRPAIWNTQLAPGGRAMSGVSATYPSGSALPSGFTLNGSTACTVTR
jgi:hypothetical protein